MIPEHVENAIIAAKIPAVAKEVALPLVESWIETFGEKDSAIKSIAAEVGFLAQLDPWTYITGVFDWLAMTPKGTPFAAEWKTTKEPGGRWNEQAWLDSISSGPQLATYALGMTKGHFCSEGKELHVPELREHPPIIKVRAITKARKSDFWPHGDKGFYRFDEKELVAVSSAYINAAKCVRALRMASKHDKNGPPLPWQLRGFHCKKFGRACDHWESCGKNEYPTGPVRFLWGTDPAAEALTVLGTELDLMNPDPRLVIFSQSSYSVFCECMEKYRRAVVTGEGETSIEMDIGSAVHAGFAAFYRGLKGEQ
jgi:hypothetical protein